MVSISVIITTYNRQDLLCKTLSGYVNQSATDLIKELIVVDDGSDDSKDNQLAIKKITARATFPVHYLYQDTLVRLRQGTWLLKKLPDKYS